MSTNNGDDFSAQRATLQSEQFIDGAPAPLRNEETGEPLEPVKDKADDEEVDNDAEVENDAEEGEEGEEDDGLGEAEPEEDEETGEKKPLSQSAKLTRALRETRKELAEMKRTIQAEKYAAAVAAATPKNTDGTPKTIRQQAKERMETDEKAPKKPDPTAKDASGKYIYPLGEFDNRYADDKDDYLEARREYLEQVEDELYVAQNSAPKAAPASAQDDIGTAIATFTADDKGVKGFKEAVEAAKADKFALTEPMARLILDSEVGRELTVHLHQNPKLAKEIADMTPIRQITRLGKLEDDLAAKRAAAKNKPASSAPTPISAARGGGSRESGGYDSENFEDVQKRWKSSNKK